ncbi:putative spermidine/putrescine transport system permease protein [Aureimonas altamirensis DSM 21988]|jgi:putative spermidine/putrescine transport system permease protein|uniref:Mannopine ABC transporter permease n=2 Tax=Aureimonas altamirensis TaxID=370622 RepID=A0A0P0YVS5_9HYPH|nr:ABC transporter permease [Aureimonas altamirensis]BAT25460.1 mannopine ABC transporter permease [Aureimonas altamirensis]SHK01607.1 putative spermidine/putrescine transport system permease protein [Aureimonas altamirensis DSM 21988]
MTHSHGRRRPILLTLPALLLFALLLVAPLAMIAGLSLQNYDLTTGLIFGFTLDNYIDIATDGYYHSIFLRTISIAVATTLVCILIGAPEAYILSRMRRPWRAIFLVVTLSPLLISVVVRTLGWALLFGRNGVINDALGALGLASAPIPLLYTWHGVVIALVHVAVPFMVISVWASLQRIDPKVSQAAISLGASEVSVFFRIILPQVIPGVLSGSLIVFAMAASAFATPAIIGGRQLKVVATATYDEFLGTLNWPLGAAIAVVLLVVNALIMLSYNTLVERYYARFSR